jgi:hypothetical protein
VSAGPALCWRMLFRRLLLVASLGLGACSSSSGSDSECGTALIGPSGGAIVGGGGAALVVPPGALAASTEVSICTLTGFAPRRDQLSDVVVVRPPSLELAVPATFTLPISSTTLREGRIEIGRTVEDGTPVVLTELRAASASVSFEHDRFGYLRVFGLPSGPVDAGGDANRDAARSDVGPPPLAPVVVGIDLDPADYSCLGTRDVPANGSLVPVDLHVVDWHDGNFRASYQLRVLLTPPLLDSETDCSFTPDCVFATSDATGHAEVMIPSGPVWIDVVGFDPMGTFIDDRHTPARQAHLPLVVPVEGGPLEIEAVSQRTRGAVGGFVSTSLGRVRDCRGQRVQRARIRVFDQIGGSELPRESSPVTYGSTSGLPFGGTDRTGPDGTFLVDNQTGIASVRLEAWGQLVVGGPEVMLACELREITSGQLVVAELVPAAADRSTSCSE